MLQGPRKVKMSPQKKKPTAKSKEKAVKKTKAKPAKQPRQKAAAPKAKPAPQKGKAKAKPAPIIRKVLVKTPVSKIKARPPEKKPAIPEAMPPQKPEIKPTAPPIQEKPAEKKPELKQPAPPAAIEVEMQLPITVKELAIKISLKPNDLIKQLMSKGIFANINQSLQEEIARDIAREAGYAIKKPPTIEEELLKDHHDAAKDETGWITRAPVVTLMGHVDHGKTSLLDRIRDANVADKERGGITQHIGAYEVMLKKGHVTFLDTPGHEAFTAMRARGANATDVVVLVVAADDGIMPQTKEAINHARAAGVPIVVAVNKCDLPSANIDRVRKQLAEHDLAAEDWGGKTIVLPVSAKTGEGVEDLLEMLLLEAELLELKANPRLKARGVVIEGHLSPGKGPVATVLVTNGTLRAGDIVMTGLYYGKVRAMLDDKGHRIHEAGPSKPVEILGLPGVPQAGDEFFQVKDEQKAKTLCTLKQTQDRHVKLASRRRVTLEDIFTQAKEGIAKELKIVLKGDVQGSVEALSESLRELSTSQITLNVIHSAVGSINDSDAILAAASNAVIIGFNVKVESKAQATADKEGVEIKNYHIIYEAIADVKAAMEGMLEPISKEVFMGRALVRQVFKVSKVGTIAGCHMVKGKISRQAKIKQVRDKEVIFEGKISSLKRFKDDVREVMEGFECGIGLSGGRGDIKEGDLIEAYVIEQTAQRLK
ncbi:MAG: translation initiation factor IF-2 [Candidatus Omnitrophota bacterium]